MEEERRGGGFEMQEERSGTGFRLEQERSGGGFRLEQEKSGRAALVLEVFFCCFAYFGSKFDHVLYVTSKM